MITTILFDLDGTLLPMDQDIFIRAYMGGLAAKMAPYGYEPQKLIKSIWKGTGAMTTNDGALRNDALFWQVFSHTYGKDCRKDEPIFEEFYRVEFQKVKESCGFDPRAAETVCRLKEMGFSLVLATNPLFPAIATHSRVRWAGLEPEQFQWITTYENSFHCKPNPDYYRDILDIMHVSAEECLMVGNDVTEDLVAETLGMKVFLLTDCMINRDNREIDHCPHGSFPELMEYIRSL